MNEIYTWYLLGICFHLNYHMKTSQETSEILEFIILNFLRCILLDTLLHPFVQVGKRENIICVCVLFDSRKAPCIGKSCEEAGYKN